jgi:cytochrome c-type protein NapC
MKRRIVALAGAGRGSLSVAVLLFAAGIIFWGGFNTAMEATNTLAFCISCHEMENTVYQEYRHSVHYSNASGVQATCPDCHVPKEWTAKFIRKIKASRELYYWLLGTIDTREKFEAKRLELATRVWETMQKSDSHECRN